MVRILAGLPKPRQKADKQGNAAKNERKKVTIW